MPSSRPRMTSVSSTRLHSIKQGTYVTSVGSPHCTPHGWRPCSDQTTFPGRSTILQQQFNRTGKAEHGSVALPAVMRSGSSGPETFNVGSMPSPQQQVMVGQMHRGHMPPLVRLPVLLPRSLVCCLQHAGWTPAVVMG